MYVHMSIGTSIMKCTVNKWLHLEAPILAHMQVDKIRLSANIHPKSSIGHASPVDKIDIWLFIPADYDIRHPATSLMNSLCQAL